MRRRRIDAAVLGGLLIASQGAQLAAHEPNDGNASWSGLVTSGPSTFKWGGAGYPGWFTSGMQDVMEVNWADPDDNNSASIRFDHSTTGQARIYFATTTDVAECNSQAWQGCALLSGWTWKLWIRQNLWTWCQDQSVTGCLDVERVGIHEAGHIGGFLAENEDTPGNTVMQSEDGVPPMAEPGWAMHTLRRCDHARMQMLYDVDDLFGPYGDCFDHVPNAGTYGMEVDLTQAPTSKTVCSGTPVTVSGRLDVADGHYGRVYADGSYRLDGNPLAGRTITIKRNGFAYTTAIAGSSTTGNNWTKVITQTVSSTTTYSFTAQFVRPGTPTAMETGLDSSNIRSFSITVVEPADC